MALADHPTFWVTLHEAVIQLWIADAFAELGVKCGERRVRSSLYDWIAVTMMFVVDTAFEA